MICPTCKGNKTLLKKEQGKGCYEVVLGICDKCHGSGEVQMTEQEYIQTCNTEQLAWFIAKAMLFYDNTTMSLLDAIKKAIEYDKKASDHFTDDIVEWLKQPHKE